MKHNESLCSTAEKWPEFSKGIENKLCWQPSIQQAWFEMPQLEWLSY